MFNDIIELLLVKKENLRAEIEREFAARAEKIDALLNMAGYVPPVVEEVAEEAHEEPTQDHVQAPEQAPVQETTQAPVDSEVTPNGLRIY